MKLFRLLPAVLLLLSAAAGHAAPAVPEAPAIAREVTGVTNLWVGTNATPMFTRPHIPSFRTSLDGRVAIVVEGGGTEGGTPRFTLMMPEKMTNLFLHMPASAYTMSQTNFKYLDTGTSSTNYTLGGQGASHACLWDPTDGVLNPWVNASLQDVYDLKVMVTSTTTTNNIKYLKCFVTPVRVIVSNPKTTSAFISSITKLGATVGGPVFTNCSGFEPVVVGDGRLLVLRVGSGSRSWINPTNNVVQPATGMDIVYSYYTNSTAQADPAHWTNMIPIAFAPHDSRINQKFGFAMAPFRDGEGTLLTPTSDIGGSYPWMDREAKNLFFEAVKDMLHYATVVTNGTNVSTNYFKSRYPQTNVVEEAADYSQGEDGGRHQGVSFLGLWSHGKLIQLDNLNNEVDYAVGQGDNRSDGSSVPTIGPQQRMVQLYLTNSGPFNNESGWLRMGYGRATKKMPKGENDNGDIIDSLENLFNYRTNFLAISLRDVAWPVGSGSQTDELSFDDYLDPDAFIIANMAGLLSGNTFTHHSGWNTTTKTFSLPVKLQNAATAKTNRWVVPKHGLVIGNGRLEPAASGGVHGKGFSMDGSIGLEFAVTNQPLNIYTNNWYVGLFVDCRFVNDTTSRLLLSFPDGSSVQLYGRSQVLYADAFGSIVHRITIPTVVTNLPASAMDDLLPDRDWAHLAFQVRKAGTEVDFHLNGLIFNRWQDLNTALFQMPPGRMTIGKNTNGAFNAIPGFAGWVDDFKVIAHAVDFETACNHANGTLIGLPTAYTGEWKTRFADRFPAWTQDEITKVLRNNGETNHPRYASFYDYRKDNGAHRGSIPAGTVSLRQSVHFPEGPLFHNAPRPHSAANTFCLSCHHSSADGGLDLTAITLDTFWTAANDPRRQPMQPRQMILGRIPAGLVDKTGLPAAATTTAPTGQPIDQWMLSASNAAPVVKSFTVVDALTRRDLIELTNNGVIDPARLGATNLTLRANLDTAQGSVTLQYDSYAANTKSRPPYTAFGTISSPYVGSNLVAGAHTIKATPQSGALSNLNFTVVGGTARVVAGYRTDFKTHSPLPGWNYEWNAVGSITNRANYRYLAWSPSSRYTASGSATYPDNSITNGPYLGLTSTGGHPGRGTAQGAGGFDRFAIASYTAKLAGYYGLTNTFVTCSSTNGNGGQVIVYTDTNGGATFTQKTNRLYGAGATANFNLNTGFLQKDDTIYVTVGPNTSDGSDGFTLDFNIMFKETGNPLP